MITCVQWIKQGAALEIPVNYSDLISGSQQEYPVFEFEGKAENDDPWGMSGYDKEDSNPVVLNADLEFHNNADDPYITDHDAYEEVEYEDLKILSDDLILMAAVSEDEEVSHLDFYIYQFEEDNIYPHHDYLLPSFPLCIEWFDYIPGVSADDEDKGSFMAVGTFEPFVEIWNLDIIDQGEPSVILGAVVAEDEDGDAKELVMEEWSHKDAVLSISWNRFYRNVLATGSGDRTVKIWDLANSECIGTFKMHTDKVQCVIWNPAEANILATGGFDHKVNVFDVRNPDGAMSTILQGEVENIAWLPEPFNNNLLVSDDLGYLYCFDILKGLSEPVWTIQAHPKPTQTIAANPRIPGFIATGAPDTEGPIKLWDISSGKPVCIYIEPSDIGPVFSLHFSEDNPFLLCIGTRGERPSIFNTKSIEEVEKRFGSSEYLEQTTNSSPVEPFQIREQSVKSENTNSKKRRKRGKKN